MITANQNRTLQLFPQNKEFPNVKMDNISRIKLEANVVDINCPKLLHSFSSIILNVFPYFGRQLSCIGNFDSPHCACIQVCLFSFDFIKDLEQNNKNI